VVGCHQQVVVACGQRGGAVGVTYGGGSWLNDASNLPLRPIRFHQLLANLVVMSHAQSASPAGRSPIVGPPGFGANLCLIPVSVDLAGHGVVGVAALGSVVSGGEVAQG
jgi:hypothetical protein